jgi:hypothetical protein
MPVAGRIALGRVLLEQGNAPGAVELLQSAWDEIGASNSTLKQACGWPLAKALRQRGGGAEDMALAGQTLLTLANIAESESAAASALQSAVALLQWSIDNTDKSTSPAVLTTIKESLRTGLRRALEHWPDSPSADKWKMRLSGLSSPTRRRQLLEAITPRSELFVRARLALAWIEFDELRKTPSAAQREAVAFTMLQYVQQAQQALENSLDEDKQRSDIHQAAAVASAELGRFDRAVAEAIKWDDAGGVGSPDAVDYVRITLSHALDDALFAEDSLQAETLAQSLSVIADRALRRAADGRTDRSTVDFAVLDLARSLLLLQSDDDHAGASQTIQTIQTWADRLDVSRGVAVALAMTRAAVGDSERAFALYREVVDASRTLDVSDEFFWRSWIGMLTILSENNTTGERSESILRQIAQLRAMDPQLGGRLTRRRIEALERSARAADPQR